MATSTALSLLDVVNALQVLTVEETKDLTLQLRVELHVLDSIEARYHGNSFKSHSFQSWLDNDVEAKWETIITGLKRIGKNVLAERVATQYCPQYRVPIANSPASDPSSSATAHMEQPVNPPTQIPVSGVTQSSITPAITASVRLIPFLLSSPSNPPRPPHDVTASVPPIPSLPSPPSNPSHPPHNTTTSVPPIPFLPSSPSNPSHPPHNVTASVPPIPSLPSPPSNPSYPTHNTTASVPPIPSLPSPPSNPPRHLHNVTVSVPPIPSLPSPPSNPPRHLHNDRVAEVKERVGHLESEFLVVVSQFRRAMTKKEVRDKEFLEDFRDALLLLPVAKQVSHARFFQKRESEIIAAKRIRILITILCRYWNYSNYDLLQYLISVFGGEPLKGDMLKNCEILERFEIETTIDIFLAAFSANSELSVAFSHIVSKINKPPSECTLHNIRKFREALAVQSSVCSYCIYVDTITTSSVRVTLGFHLSALGWVLAALSPSFLESHQLSDVVVEGEPLLLFEMRDLVCLMCMYTLYIHNNMHMIYVG